MKNNFLILSITLLIFTACSTGYKMSSEVRNAPYIYVDFEKFKEGRVCSDVKFECLPESQDKAWQSEPLADGLDVFELNENLMKHYNTSVEKMWEDYENYHSKSHPKGEKEPMFINDLERTFFDKVEAKQFLVEMEDSLEKEFPGFWRNTAKKVRYRWIRRAMSKADKYGYNGHGMNIRAKIDIIELCARIGLDFDFDPKWKAIIEFISLPNGPSRAYAGEACHYIDFTIFEKNHDRRGNRYTDWYLRDSLNYLPQPKRPVPKLND